MDHSQGIPATGQLRTLDTDTPQSGRDRDTKGLFDIQDIRASQLRPGTAPVVEPRPFRSDSPTVLAGRDV